MTNIKNVIYNKFIRKISKNLQVIEFNEKFNQKNFRIGLKQELKKRLHQVLQNRVVSVFQNESEKESKELLVFESAAETTYQLVDVVETRNEAQERKVEPNQVQLEGAHRVEHGALVQVDLLGLHEMGFHVF